MQEPARPKDRKRWYLRKGVALFSHLAAPLPSNLNICQQGPPGPLMVGAHCRGSLLVLILTPKGMECLQLEWRPGQPRKPDSTQPLRKPSEDVVAIVNNHCTTSQL